MFVQKKIQLFTSVVFAGALACAMPASAQIFGGDTGNKLLGAGIGAGLGGILGSNLAGSGVQQEGTAIGAVVGGLLGASVANGGSRYGNGSRYAGHSGHGGGYQNGAGGGYSYGGGASYGGGYAYPQQVPTTQYVHGGNQVQTYTIPHRSTQVYHPAPAPRFVCNTFISRNAK